jgi:hypothetical protein
MSWLEQHDRKDESQDRSGMLSSPQAIAAIITGIFGLAIAFVTGLFSAPHIGLVSGAQPAPTVTTTRTVTVIQTITATPTPDVTASTPPQVAPQPSQKPVATAIPLLSPSINQPGWTLAWHQKVSIDPEGIIFGSSAPSIGEGSNYDLQYVPGDGNSWRCGNSHNLGSWSYGYRPGPATIIGLVGIVAGCASGQTHVGDRYFVTLSNAGGVVIIRIVYMQIIGIGPGGIVAEAWVWNSASA